MEGERPREPSSSRIESSRANRFFLSLCALATAFLVGCEKPPPGTVTVLTERTFDKAISKGVVLVDFWGDWCVPCIEQRKIVAEIAAEMSGQKGIRIANLDLGFEEAREKVAHLNIEYVPMLIVFKKGKPFKTFEGLTQKEPLVEAIEEAKGRRHRVVNQH